MKMCDRYLIIYYTGMNQRIYCTYFFQPKNIDKCIMIYIGFNTILKNTPHRYFIYDEIRNVLIYFIISLHTIIMLLIDVS